MNALTRFVSLGLQDADRRIAAALTPRPFGAVDRYLRSSVIVTALDRLTVALSASWQQSRSRRFLSSLPPIDLRDASGARRVGLALLIAVAVHVALSLVQGPRPGWFWMLIPGMVLVLAASLLAGVRSAPRP